MATTLFLGKSITSGPNANSRDLRTTRDAGSIQVNVATTASGNHLIYTSGGTNIFWYQVAAVTVSGTVSFNFWGLEDAMTTNSTAAARVVRCDSAGNELSDVVDNANAGHVDNAEYGTASALQTWTATPTSTTFSGGDWIKVEPHADAFGTMAVGQASIVFAGTTGGASGDTFVTFTETIVAFSGSAANPPYVNPMPPLIAQ